MAFITPLRLEPKSRGQGSSDYHRTTLIPKEHVFGLDSTQGYLEFADSSQDNKSQIAFRKSDESNFSTHYYRLKQLEREQLIEAEWTSEAIDSVEYNVISQMCLTTSGKELLERLREKSKRGRLRAQFRQLFWTVLTSVITTLIVLYLKG